MTLMERHHEILDVFTEPIAARVLRGVEWLDQALPGWLNELNLGQLDMTSGCDCIVGQVFGGSHVVNGELMSSFSIVSSWAHILGLDYWTLRHGFIAKNDREYPELEAVWVTLIKERFASATLA